MVSGDIWRRKASLTQSVANRAARKLAAREEKMNVIDMQRKESVKRVGQWRLLGDIIASEYFYM
jgi:hypothetical protein